MPNLKSDPLAGPKQDALVQQKLEALKKEYAGLHTQKITTEANIRNLEDNLAKLRAAAEKDYGTSDIEELKEILETRRQENEARVTTYEQHIRELKENLTAIEAGHAEEA
jgi:hypothetical protein